MAQQVCGEIITAGRAGRRGCGAGGLSGFGNLLAESFVCALGPGSMQGVRFGLILNTGLTGRYLPGGPSETPRCPSGRARAAIRTVPRTWPADG